VTRVQIIEQANPPNLDALGLPADRAAANAMGIGGPTRADIVEFRNLKIAAPERCPLELDQCFADDFVNEEGQVQDDLRKGIPLTGSARYDTDWYRLVSCLDPWSPPSPLRGIVYQLGSIAGSWAGRFVVFLVL
jgi:hypothetical protein